MSKAYPGMSFLLSWYWSCIAFRKPTVVKAKKPAASFMASLTRPKEGYVYEGKGKSGDKEFSTWVYIMYKRLTRRYCETFNFMVIWLNNPICYPNICYPNIDMAVDMSAIWLCWFHMLLVILFWLAVQLNFDVRLPVMYTYLNSYWLQCWVSAHRKDATWQHWLEHSSRFLEVICVDQHPESIRKLSVERPSGNNCDHWYCLS